MNLRRVRVKMPKAQSGLEVKMKAGLGFNANQLSWPVMAGEFSEPDLKERQVLGPTDWDNANLEAEKGETVVTDLHSDGIPEQYMIGGKRHYDGGTPLNLPDNSFIFSRDITMKVRDKNILEQFGITSAPRAGLTPADIAKRFNINKYKKVLLDSTSDDLAKKTAEMMIVNYNLKLGMLAIVQESMKGFPDGMPMIAMPYIESIGLTPEQFMPVPKNQQPESQDEEEIQSQEEEPEADMARYGRAVYAKGGEPVTWDVIYSPTLGKPMFVGYDAEGRFITSQSNNPFDGDNTTADEYYRKMKKAQKGGGDDWTEYNPDADETAVQDETKEPDFQGGLAEVDDTEKVDVPLADSGTDIPDDPKLDADRNQLYRDLATQVKNPKVRAEFLKKYKAELAKKFGANSAEYKKYIEKGDDYLINKYLNFQKQLLYINKHSETNSGIYSASQNYNWDTTPNHANKNKRYREAAKEAGVNEDDLLSDEDSFLAQAGYNAFADVINDANLADEFKDFERKENVERGPDQGGGNRRSAVDGVIGDNTIQQFNWLKRKKQPDPPEEKEKSNVKIEEGDEEETSTNTQIKRQKLEIPEQKKRKMTPWWLQDVIQVHGDWMDYARIKKYMPWQATPGVDFVEPTFYSPERELAANAQQLAIGSQGLSNFTSPEAYTSRFSALAGQAAANSADIMARYNNMNVGVANEAEKYNTDIFNSYAQNRAQSATQLYDKLSAVNQKYDNAKAASRQKMRADYINAITNRAQADVMNTLYRNYKINTATGGTEDFEGTGDITALRSDRRQDILSRAQTIYDQNQGRGITMSDALKLAGMEDPDPYKTPPIMSYPQQGQSEEEEQEEE